MTIIILTAAEAVNDADCGWLVCHDTHDADRAALHLSAIPLMGDVVFYWFCQQLESKLLALVVD